MHVTHVTHSRNARESPSINIPQSLCLVIVARLQNVDRLVHVHTPVVQSLPLLAFNASLIALANGVPILVHQRRSPSIHHFVLALHCAGASQSVFWISWVVGTVSAQLAVVHRRGMNCACGISSIFAIFGPCPCVTACMISTVFGIFLMVGIRFCIAGSSP